MTMLMLTKLVLTETTFGLYITIISIFWSRRRKKEHIGTADAA